MIEIIGTELNQWDTGRSVRVTGTEASHVHLANQGDSKAVIMELADSLALIPDYLLQTGKQLCVYAVANGVTIESKVFFVKKRERPENYVYEDDQRNFIYELITDAQDATNAANQVAHDLLEAKERGDFTGEKGKDGKDGKDGEIGGYYIPSVSDEGILSWTPSVQAMPQIASTDLVNTVISNIPNGDEESY